MDKCICIKEDSPIMIVILNAPFYVSRRGSKIKKGDILYYEIKPSIENKSDGKRYYLSLSDDINMSFFHISEKIYL